MAINSIGTEMWFIDNSTLVKLGCPTNISGIGAERESKESPACLETGLTQTFTGALKMKEITVDINLDPAISAQKKIWDALIAGTQGMKFAIGLADGTDAPTNTGNVFTLATTRSWYEITGAVKSETDNIGTAANTLTAQIVIVPTALLRLEKGRA